MTCERITGVPFSKVVPALMTLGALCAGVTGVRYSMDGLWTQAVSMIILAAVLDGLDGRVAGLLNAKSDFGAELDSLADVVSFGVSPALILWNWSLHESHTFGWLAALSLTACIALRLARFNSMLGKAPHYAYNFFSGIPAPACALLATLPMTLSFGLAQDQNWIRDPEIVGVWTLCVGGLAVSSLPTWSLKKMRAPKPVILLLVLLFVGVIAMAINHPWATLAGLGGIYILSFPFSAWQYSVLRKKAQSLKDKDATKTTKTSCDVEVDHNTDTSS